MQACFIGHRNIQKNEVLTFSLKQIIIDLINQGVTTFLFGNKSEFDALSWEIVTALKQTYPFIKRVYYRATNKFIDESYEKYLLEYYEETYFSPKLERAGKYSYVERNYIMIDNSTYCVFYYNANYVAPYRRQSENKMLLRRGGKSGTKIAYDYAIKRNKKVFNLYK